MAENDDIIALKSEVESLRMMILQLQQERGGAGGPSGGFFPIGDFRSGGGSGSDGDGDEGITVDDNAVVAVSMDYVNTESDEDFAAHPYAIRLRRGQLKLVNGVLTVVEDNKLKQFVDTTPLSGTDY